MKIEILGTGCYKCLKLEALVDEVLKELGATEIDIIRVNDERQIRKFMPLDEIPGLVIDDHLISTGHVPEKSELLSWLHEVSQRQID